MATSSTPGAELGASTAPGARRLQAVGGHLQGALLASVDVASALVSTAGREGALDWLLLARGAGLALLAARG